MTSVTDVKYIQGLQTKTEAKKMVWHTSLFSQLLSLLPRHSFHGLVIKHEN